MNLEEFNHNFDTLLNSHSGNVADIVCDEYEKSVFLTLAQQEVAVSLYNGKTIYAESFESTEENRRYLEALIKFKVYSNEDSEERIGVSNTSKFFKLPEDLAYITLEQVVFDDESLGCYNNGNRINVQPINQDYYNTTKDNPFRNANKRKVLRLDNGDGYVELVSSYNIGKYYVTYLQKPTPIILIDLPDNLSIEGYNVKTECKLNPILHSTILTRAVNLAIATKMRGLAAQKEK